LNTDEVARLAEIQRESVQQAAHRFDSLRRRHEGRQDLAWWPPRPEPEPCAPGNLFFYRPGELLVRAEALPAVRGVLRELGVRTCAPDRHDRHDRKPEPVVRILVASRDPVPLLLDRLRCYGLGHHEVSVNHVFFLNTCDNLDATPWFSGGAESLPAEAETETVIQQGQGEPLTIVAFDSGLLDGYLDLRNPFSWLQRVGPADNNRDVEPAPALLDLYDNHGLFVAGIIGYTSPQSKVVVLDILSERGAVDEYKLAVEIRSYLDANQDVRLVNLSLGGTTLDNSNPLGLKKCIDAYPNVVFVASAGNNGQNGQRFYPADFRQVIGVGALGANNLPACFSNTISADVWARGVDVVSAFRPGELPVPPPSTEIRSFNSGLARWSGTSFSTPRVTGVLSEYVAGAGPQSSGPGALEWLARYRVGTAGRIIVP
jgi:hypothetical protein